MKSMDANVIGSVMYHINRGYATALIKTTALLLGVLECMANVLDNHKVYHKPSVFSPCLGVYSLKIKQFPGGGAFGKN